MHLHCPRLPLPSPRGSRVQPQDQCWRGHCHSLGQVRETGPGPQEVSRVVSKGVCERATSCKHVVLCHPRVPRTALSQHTSAFLNQELYTFTGLTDTVAIAVDVVIPQTVKW